MAKAEIEDKTDLPAEENACIQVLGLYKIYGPRNKQSLQKAQSLAEDEVSQEEILKRTGCMAAVQGVTFDVRHRETFVIMGLSGCGKSTVLRCLNRLIEPTAGEVQIDGRNILALSPDDLREMRRQKLAMVFQHFALLPHRNVLENAAYGLEICKVAHDERQRRAQEALELVGLGGHATSAVQALSGGMKQRVGLARALATGSDILLMDEAFSALDPLIRSEMQDELSALQARMQKTVVFITHDLNEALKLGDRVAIMKAGRIVQIGTPEEILTHPVDQYVRSFVENVDRRRVITAGSIMRQPRALLGPHAGPRLAMRWANEFGLGLLFVVDAQRRLKGAVHVDDVVRLLERDGDDAGLGTVLDTEVSVTTPDTPVDRLLRDASQSHDPIPVVDEKSVLVGLVTRTAILSAMTGRDEMPGVEES